jgi:deoxyribonuclease IV
MRSEKRLISLHLHINNSLYETALQARALGRRSFQCFFMVHSTGKRLVMRHDEIRKFVMLREAEFELLFVHGSYWINIAACDDTTDHYVLRRELHLAQALHFTHYVLHCGSATGCENRLEGIDYLVRSLNMIHKKYPVLTIVLENTAHGGLSVGSDIEDFMLIKEKLEYPERITFCLDTAHAYAFGYDIAQESGRQDFFSRTERYMGINQIALIHLNDALELLGSKKDRHAVPGQGLIGAHALKQFMTHEAVVRVPVIVELPTLPYDQQQALLTMLEGWDVKSEELLCVS